MTSMEAGTPNASPAARLAVHIRAILPALRPSERRVAEAVLAKPQQAVASTISELAMICGTSEATVTRFCKTIGLPGYPQLRLTLATSVGDQADRRFVGGDILASDDLSALVAKVTFANAQAVHDTAEQLDLDSLRQAIEAVVAADRVDIYGVGASSLVGADLQQKLNRIGRVAIAYESFDLALVSASLLRERAVGIGISYSGETPGTIEPLLLARQHGATTIAITNFPRSTLARHAHVVLTTAGREITLRAAAMASRSAQLAVIDCLFVGVAQSTYDQTCEALETTYLAVHSRAGRRHTI